MSKLVRNLSIVVIVVLCGLFIGGVSVQADIPLWIGGVLCFLLGVVGGMAMRMN